MKKEKQLEEDKAISFDVITLFISIYLDIGKKVTRELLQEYYSEEPLETEGLQATRFVPISVLQMQRWRIYIYKLGNRDGNDGRENEWYKHKISMDQA